MVLEAAVNGQCKVIITYNLKDFDGIERFAIEAMRPRDF